MSWILVNVLFGFLRSCKIKTEVVLNENEVEIVENDNQASLQTQAVEEPRKDWNRYFTLFEKTFPQARIDLLSEELMFFDDKRSKWRSSTCDEILSYLKALAIEARLKPSHVKYNLVRYMRRIREERGLELLIDIPEWDGFDSIGSFAQKIHSPLFTHNQIAEILKEWFSLAFERLHNQDLYNSCLIFVGKQGMGKDVLIKAMTKGFGRFVIPLQFQSQQRDMYQALHTGIVAYAEEFDNLADKLEEGFLKALISTPHTMYREAYGRSQEMREAKWSLLASCNREDFLRDCTGNRRFIVIPIDRIDGVKTENGQPMFYPDGLIEYPANESLKLLSQAKFLAKERFRASREIKDLITSYIAKLTPVNPEDEFFKDFLDYVSQSLPSLKIVNHCYFLPTADHQDQLIKIARNNSIKASWPKLKGLLSRKGINCEVRDSKRRGVGVPMSLIADQSTNDIFSDIDSGIGVNGNGCHSNSN